MGCGICGFVGLSDRDLLKAMCGSIRHRGPNQTDYFLDEEVGLGIDRLSIIDLVTGDQPIHNEDETIWVVFNGEIYNYQALKAELEASGHRFYTSSDTETLVHAYEQWGDDCVQHLRGMFGFAIWDSKKKKLYLARDRFGKKPLYYALVGGALLFGSEMKAILAYDAVPRELDYTALDLFFTYMHIPSPYSIFKSVRKLPPACYATYAKGVFAVHQYWDFTISPDSSMTEARAVAMLHETIRDAVKVRMRSDVPLGAFLSGGIDSSTVAAFMARLSDVPIKTVSIGFNEKTNELPYARKVAEFLKTDHKEHIVTPDAFGILPRLIEHFDEPFADHSLIPTYYLSQVTREDLTVALSGDGGDELFMGYPFLLDPPSYSLYSKIPSQLRGPALKAILTVPVNSQVKRMAGHAQEKGYASQPYATRFAMRVSLYNEEGLSRLYSRQRLESHLVAHTYEYLENLVEASPSKVPLDSLDYATVRSYLEEGILVKVDRMSMAVSLEVRCPLLDQEVAALVGKIPASMKMRGRETKYIFKKMAVEKGLIPREIAYRSKQGFGAPIEAWMQNQWKDVVSQTLDPVVSNGYTGLFDGQRVKALMSDPYLNSNKLFALMVFVMWYGIYAEGNVKAPIINS